MDNMWRLTITTIPVVLLAACGPVKYATAPYNPDTRSFHIESPAGRPLTFEEIQKSWVQRQGEFLFRFQPTPERPAAGESTLLALRMTKGGSPVANAAVSCRIHAFPARENLPVSITQPQPKEIAPGLYTLTNTFPEARDWEVDYTVVLDGDRRLRISFLVRAGSDTLPANQVRR